MVTASHTRTPGFRPILPPTSCWKVDLALSLVTYGEQICRVTMAAWAWLRVALTWTCPVHLLDACHEALSPSSLRGGQPGSGRPRPRPPSPQKAVPGSPRLPEHHPCCLDRPAAQLPAGLFPQMLPWRVPSTLPLPRGQRCPPGATGHMGLCRPLGSHIEAGLDRR